MSKTAAQREAAEIYRREQQELEWQSDNRLALYRIWKALRDVGDTGNKELDAMVKDLYNLAEKIKDKAGENQ